MGIQQWAGRRLARADPSLGVLGPVLWLLAGMVLAVGIYASLAFTDAELMVPATAALAAILALASAPVWMARVAARSHHRRNTLARQDADALRRHLEAAYVEKRITEDDFQSLDADLDAIRSGRGAGAVAATSSRYLRGVAWSLLLAGVILGACGLSAGAVLYDWGTRQGEDPYENGLVQAMWTAASVAAAAGVGLAILFGGAARATAVRARELRQRDETLLQDTRQRLLGIRRG